MIQFSYIARESSGRIARGQLAAESPAGLKALLQSMGLQLVTLNALASPQISLLQVVHPKRWLPPRSRDVELALRQLAVMLRSGLNLLHALKALRMQTELSSFASVLDKVHQAVAQGDSLATALQRHRVFPQIAVQLVRVGEQTGKLERVLEQAAKYMTQRRTAIAEVRVALTYPAVVACAAMIIAGYLIFAVIPELQKFLTAMGRKLPRMTQNLVDLAQWFQLHGSSACVALLAAIAGLWLVVKWPPGRLWIDRYILKLPIIGSIFRLSGTATLANSLAVMIDSGVKLIEALAIAGRIQSNRFLAGLVSDASDSVIRGRAIAPTLNNREGFVPMLGSMVEVAERTGHLGTNLEEVAKFCEVELKSKVKRMSLLVEPAVIVIAGCIVGYVYIAFFMALMSAGGNFK